MSKEDLKIWDTNAEFWDNKMGENSNRYHNQIVRPLTEKYLDITAGDFVLDIACGNGNFSKRMAELGATVVAFDFSSNMIAAAKTRRKDYLDKIEFHVCDATNYEHMMHLRKERPFNKAVSNMGMMDISDIEPIFKALSQLLEQGGIFVFSTHHPCFVRPDGVYITPKTHKGEAILNQPVLQNYYHRSLQDLFGLAFRYGFVICGFSEVPDPEPEIPDIIIVKLKLIK
jgi:2-polyprenyl-3-methyl-5-hydroxy-6-metoxy-1,4-benzoquinol methylase